MQYYWGYLETTLTYDVDKLCKRMKNENIKNILENCLCLFENNHRWRCAPIYTHIHTQIQLHIHTYIIIFYLKRKEI